MPEGDKFFDVAHPGQTAADASSKPVIVGNRSILKDPMMADKPADTQGNTLQSTVSHPKVQPSADLQKDIEQPDVLPKAEQAAKASTPQLAKSSEEMPENIHKLIEDRTYFVHVGSRQHGWLTKILLVIGLLLAALAFGYYMMNFVKK